MKYTKEQLEGMSDFEINSIILEIEAKKDGVTINNIRKHRLANKLKCFSRAVLFDTDAGNKSKVDYCNNWADMGTLIDSSDISIIKDDGYDWATNHPQERYEPMGDKEVCAQITSNCKTLRAAAIVYLLMQEGE